MIALIFIYALGALGFGGILLTVGRDDFSWPALVALALGWPALLAAFVLVATLVVLFGD